MVDSGALMDLTSDDEQTWALLRERSLKPGGFGEDRSRLWPALLGAQPLSDPPPYSEVECTSGYEGQVEEVLVPDPHADERQIKLDTDRSFVLYPGDSGTTHARDALQNDLHGLLVSLFRKRRSLHYFQGFHDIMTVIFLTLPRPLHLACAEKMALHRVRDAMGVGLEPVLGLLRVLRNLLRLADPPYAKLLESTSPLPYHALSHLLTLFSHDVPSLPLIQHVWDFLLSREPIAVVWLAAALILHRKPSIYLFAEQDEEGMIHSLLGRMPELTDTEHDYYDMDMDDSYAVRGITTEAGCAAEYAGFAGTSIADSVDGTAGSPNVCEQAFSDRSMGDEDELHQDSLALDASENLLEIISSNPHDSTLEDPMSIPLPDSRQASPSPPPTPSSAQPSIPFSQAMNHLRCSPSSSLRSRSYSYPTLPSSAPPRAAVDEPTHVHTSIKKRSRHPPLSLTHLLRQADELFITYPPSHSLLRLTEIMGPDSAMRTWRPSPITTTNPAAINEMQTYNAADDYLETLVDSTNIVIPSPPPSPPPGPRLHAKKAKITPSKILLDPRKIGLRLGTLTSAERRMLFMGALLVVGAAVALKSGKVPSMVDGIVKASGGDGVKRLWNGKWTFISSVVAAWGRGLP